MTFSLDLSSPSSRRISVGLGVLAAASALLAFWKSEDAWGSAAWFLLSAGLGFAAFALIWLARLKTRQPLLALRDSAGMAVVVALAAMAGHQLREAELRPTKDRAETLAAAIIEHQRTHGALPVSVNEIEATLPRSTQHLYQISYKPRGNGSFTLVFSPSWYRHEYYPATRSWVKSD